MVWPGPKILKHVLKVRNSIECAARTKLHIVYTVYAELNKSCNIQSITVYAHALPCLKCSQHCAFPSG